MIAKVLAWGGDRAEALSRLARALSQTQVVVEGGRTTKAFLLALLGHPDVRAGTYDTRWLDDRMAADDLLDVRHAGVALVCAAVEAYAVEHARHRAEFYAGVARGRPALSTGTGERLEFRYRGHPYAFRVYQLTPDTYRVTAGTARVDVRVERFDDIERRLVLPGCQYDVLATLAGPVHTVEVDGATHTITRDEGGVVRAPTPAVVVSLAVAPGDDVETGDPLAVLESMKMETAVLATFPGRVRAVPVQPNTQVTTGDVLVRLEPSVTAQEPTAGPVDLGFGQAGADAGTTGAMRAYLLGYDLDPPTRRQVESGADPWAPRAADDPERLAGEVEVLQLFADVCAVSRRYPEPAEETTGERVRAPEEHLLTCLRTYGAGGTALPADFVRRLMRVLVHHGVDGLGPSTSVADALLRLYRAQHRLDEVVPAVAAVLDRWLAHPPTAVDPAGGDVHGLLDQLVAATDRRYPSLMDLARDVRFHVFERPLLNKAKAELYARMDDHVAALAAGVPPEERTRRMDELIACPHPLRPVLLRWYREEPRHNGTSRWRSRPAATTGSGSLPTSRWSAWAGAGSRSVTTGSMAVTSTWWSAVARWRTWWPPPPRRPPTSRQPTRRRPPTSRRPIRRRPLPRNRRAVGRSHRAGRPVASRSHRGRSRRGSWPAGGHPRRVGHLRRRPVAGGASGPTSGGCARPARVGRHRPR
ncbi:hypothetical protein GCM10029964_056620 [Kibdelosporangium lantanae]